MSTNSSSSSSSSSITPFFQKAKSAPSSLEDEILGPSYSYWKHINSPEEIGMSSKGSLSTLGKNVSGLIAYTELLITGGGKASKTGQPLGSQYFMSTGATCKDVKTGKSVDRRIYVNNKPTGSIPFISSGMGVDFDTFEGLIPGAIGDLGGLNPVGLFSALMESSDPSCMAITMPVTPTPANNNQTQQTEFMTENDVKALDPCLFSLMGNKNPLTGVSCKEGFAVMKPVRKIEKEHGKQESRQMGQRILTGIFVALIAWFLMRMLMKRK